MGAANNAVIVDPAVAGRLVLSEVPLPAPAPAEAVIGVHAFSLNAGEVRRAQSADAGWRPGWDFAGEVITPAKDGSGPQQGTRVVGMLSSGSWANEIAAPTDSFAPIPDNLSFTDAATLPVAGLTALHALQKGGLLLGRTVLVTGASGGVGVYAIQLSKLAGARVIAVVHREEGVAIANNAGADAVVIGQNLDGARDHGPFDVVLESVGGEILAGALAQVAPGGIIVVFGASAGGQVTFDATKFYPKGGARLYAFLLFHELKSEPARVGLTHLAALAAAGKLTAHIDIEAPWTEIGKVTQDLLARKIRGKAVMTVG